MFNGLMGRSVFADTNAVVRYKVPAALSERTGAWLLHVVTEYQESGYRAQPLHAHAVAMAAMACSRMQSYI